MQQLPIDHNIKHLQIRAFVYISIALYLKCQAVTVSFKFHINGDLQTFALHGENSTEKQLLI